MHNFSLNIKQWFSYIPIIDRYIITEVAGPFIFGVLGFVIIGMVDILFTLIDLFINSGIPFLVVFRLLIFKIPAIMVLFFPMATLFATMIVLIRMAKDSEITVFRAGGVCMLRIVAPILVAGFIVTLLSFLVNEKVVPWANHISDNLIRRAVLKKPPPDIAENTFFKESRDRYFYIRKLDSGKHLMEDIFIYETTRDFPRLITAKTATWTGQEWQLQDGFVHKFDEEGFVSYEGKFNKMNIKVDRDVNNFFSDEKTPREMSSTELKNKIKGLEKGGVDTKSLAVDFQMKFAEPAASLAFALIGAAICIAFVRSSKDWWGVVGSVLLALLTVGFYFFVMATFRSLGRGGAIPALLGAWSPNFIFMVLAGILLWREGVYK
ncbi:MAG: LptF/LptG family permease [Candidatus Margulisbacteria bacterium]|nr:LptF/LptG family permease [Candidatus Margulisiibacteriota bacterium]